MPRGDVTLPDILADALRDHRKAQLELRFRLGAGKLPDDAPLFSNLEGQPLSLQGLLALNVVAGCRRSNYDGVSSLY